MSQLRAVLHHDAFPGVLLFMAALFALVLDNSALAPTYDALLTTPAFVGIGSFAINKPLLLWINDLLMAIFFFLVGLEIKREVMEGKLADRSAAALPLAGAIGGMLAPALIYVGLNIGSDDLEAMRGWAIPAATDIAFALGVLALLGSRVPVALRAFLLTLAIVDDLGAIVIIAVFYTADVSVLALSLAGLGIAGLIALNRAGVAARLPYILIGAFIWVCVLKSGVHATLAGVVTAFAIPLAAGGQRPAEQMEHALHPYVAFGIMPIFAFANAGVALGGITLASFAQPIPLGIMLGLLVGKPVGIVGLCYLAVKLKIAKLDPSMSWKMIMGAASLAGIGFTMSLFIGALAFADPAHQTAVRIGVLSGSILSGTIGFLLLSRALKKAPGQTAEA